jgi:hypothetical protein
VITDQHNRLKKLATWVIVFCAGLYALFHFGFIIWHAAHNTDWLIQEIVQKHYAAIIVLPSAGFAALCLVLFLDIRSAQQMKLRALGFEFEGASGPIILWIMSFLACAIGIRLLW